MTAGAIEEEVLWFVQLVEIEQSVLDCAARIPLALALGRAVVARTIVVLIGALVVRVSLRIAYVTICVRKRSSILYSLGAMDMCVYVQSKRSSSQQPSCDKCSIQLSTVQFL